MNNAEHHHDEPLLFNLDNAGPADQPPAEFPLFDTDIAVDHQCPRCGYTWSGGFAPTSGQAAVPGAVDGGDSIDAGERSDGGEPV